MFQKVFLYRFSKIFFFLYGWIWKMNNKKKGNFFDLHKLNNVWWKIDDWILCSWIIVFFRKGLFQFVIRYINQLFTFNSHFGYTSMSYWSELPISKLQIRPNRLPPIRELVYWKCSHSFKYLMFSNKIAIINLQTKQSIST